MTIANVAQYNTTAADNTDINDISLAENVMKPPAVNNAFRETMAQIAQWTGEGTIASASTCDIGAENEEFLNVTGTTTITSFGTVRAGTKRVLLFASALTLTHNATSLVLRGENITTRAGDVAVFVSEGSGNWRLVNYFAATQPASRGHLYGLTLSNNSTDATNDIDIAVGEAASDDSVPVLLKLASSLTKRLDSAWVVGNNQGGRDGVGTLADGTWHVFLIRRSDTGVVDVLLSDSATAPVMPTNYDQKRRIGSILRESGAIAGFTQNGDEFLRAEPVTDVSQSQTGTSAVTRTLSVPTGIVVDARYNGGLSSSDSAQVRVLFTSLDMNDTGPSSTRASLGVRSPTGVYITHGEFRTRTNTSAQIRSRNDASNTGITLYISTFGWYDTRGKLG